MSQGRSAGLYSALGITAGTIIHTLLAALGLSLLLVKIHCCVYDCKMVRCCLFNLFRR
ncbi:hypothetical protein [Brochothrix thermosphacta]|uniref:hypothetical protein n=1 Tax=Brochothrix thermosphacta TaxID=2756 RepID=UPI0030843DD8